MNKLLTILFIQRNLLDQSYFYRSNQVFYSDENVRKVIHGEIQTGKSSFFENEEFLKDRFDFNPISNFLSFHYYS
jgi:hypothetical protein